MIGTWEILLIVLMVLILFGANKIPEFIRNFNSGIKEFKKAANDIETTKTAEDE
tara:strand:- start:330 stop:491 length:162 start_codon:yes stop_codon:yes gene_type:complete